jgi:hypothetical protein
MNLLPEDYKKELSLEAWRRFIIFFSTYAASAGIIGLVLLSPSFFFLKLQILERERMLGLAQGSAEYREMAQGFDRVDDLNRQIAAFIDFDSLSVRVGPIAEDFLSRVPQDVILSAFSYTKSIDGKITISVSGKALNRNALITFSENLQKSPFVRQEIKPQLSDLLRDVDTTFTLTFPISL